MNAIVGAVTDSGHRLTGARQKVAALIGEQSGHFTAADLMDEASRRHVAVGRATLFRNLDLFTELGALERLDLPNGDHAYVACEPEQHHHHVVCRTCRATRSAAAIDGTTVGRATDATWVAGQVGYGTGQGVTAQFDNLSITPAGGRAGPPAGARRRLQPLPGRPTPEPDRRHESSVWDCNGGANQHWTQTSSNQLTVYGTKCLDVPGTDRRHPGAIWTCNGGANQQWRSTPTAPSSAWSPGCAWTSPAPAPPTAPRCRSGPATAAATRSGTA